MRIMAILSLTGLALLAASPVLAAEKFLAAGAFCDTPEAATEFVKTWDRHNAPQVIDAINKKAGTELCTLSTVLLEEVERTTILNVPTGQWQLVKLLIWGQDMGGVRLTFSVPMTRYSYFGIEPEKLGQAI